MTSKQRSRLQTRLTPLAHSLAAWGRSRHEISTNLLVLCASGALLALPPGQAEAAAVLPTPCNPCSSSLLAKGLTSTSFVTGWNANNPQIGNKGLPVVTTTTTNGVTTSTMTINQLVNSVILNWQDFNIAKGNSVVFVQPTSSSQALNRIGTASVINGNLKSNGQVYLIDQNGIIFDKNAQVNVGSLTASTLNISDSLFTSGLLSGNTNATSSDLPIVFQTSVSGAGSTSTPSSILVAPGAQLTTTSGGRIMLLSQSVTNQGTISTPDGQTILGAGNEIMLAASDDSALRGLLIAVDAQTLENVNGTVSTTGSAQASNSTVINQGSITAAHGNITLAGLLVNQSGELTATTSVNANGSIYLLAGDISNQTYNSQSSAETTAAFYTVGLNTNLSSNILPNNGGTLTLSSGSMTQVIPDTTDKSTITVGNLDTFSTSEIDLAGKTINIEGDSQVIARGGEIDAVASANPYQASTNLANASSADGSRIFIDQGSVIDASGLQDVEVSAATNLVQVEMGSNELQDDPLLRNSWLHGQTVTININEGTPLLSSAELTDYRNDVSETVSQVLTNAGKINLTSTGDTVVKQGATLNVSGGSTQYTASTGQTSELIGADGKLYNISTAPNTVEYVGFADQGSDSSTKWGSTSSWTATSNYLPGYIQGANAGTLTIESPQIVLQGTLLGNTTVGPNQRGTSTTGSLYSNAPKGGTLIIGDATAATDTSSAGESVIWAPNLLLSNSGTLLPSTFGATDTLSTSEQQTLTLSPTAIEQGGFANLALYTNGSLTLAANTAITLPGNGSFVGVASTINIASNISIPQGTVSLTASGGDLTVAPGVSISTQGNWINDSSTLANNSDSAPIYDNGGTITLAAVDDVILGNSSQGASLDASGGGWVNSSNTLSAGKAGSIKLTANDTSVANEEVSSITGSVQLNNSTLAAYGLTQGGSLTINTASITVGNQSSGWADDLLLGADFFNTGGFQSYKLTGANHFQVDSGVQIAPHAENLLLDSDYLEQATGTDLYSFTHIGQLPIEKQGSIALSFSTTSALYQGATKETSGTGDMVIDPGSSISLDANAASSVSLTAAENLTISGQISVPGGTINLTSGKENNTAEGDMSDQLLLTASAKLYAGGAAVINTDNSNGYREGQILNGGTISLDANTGYVVTDAGSLLDVSSATLGQGVLDIISNNHGVTSVTPTLIYSNAGNIKISAMDGIVLQGALSGAAGSSTAAAGSLSIALDPGKPAGYIDSQTTFYTGTTPFFNVPDVLTVTEDNLSSATLSPTPGQALISLPLIQQGGFDSIKLSSGSASIENANLINGTNTTTPYQVDSILFQYSVLNPTATGKVDVSDRQAITLDAPVIAVAANTTANLDSAYIDLGLQDGLLRLTSADLGTNFSSDTGTLNVQKAQLIDLTGHGWLIGSTVDLQSSGDIRAIYDTDSSLSDKTDFSASLDTTGNITLDAAQVYPATLTQFTLAAAGNMVTISDSTKASSSIPLSAGGSVTVDAEDIDQSGTLRAPLGQIKLDATDALTLQPGSLTSVSAGSLTIPYGSTENGSTWVYQNDDSGTSYTTIDTAPEKKITLIGNTVSILTGAKVDVSGGGDLYAYEFVSGPGGSSDVLASNTVAAIVPSLGSSTYAPVDYQDNQGSTLAIGSQVYLSGIPGLAAGYYTLLPARYALLPGAYAITLNQANSNLALGTSIAQTNGSYEVSGYYSTLNTGIHDSQTSTFTLTPGSVIRQESEYTETSGNTFFNSLNLAGTSSSSLPVDAGVLQIQATNALTLDGSFDFSSASQGTGSDLIQGQGGTAMISAPIIDVVDAGQSGSDADALDINVSTLNNLHANTLVLGAYLDDTGDLNAVKTQQITIDASATALTAGNVILAASNQVTIANGGAISATGTTDSRTPNTFVNAGAILELSGSASASVNRPSSDTTQSGLVQIGTKANLNAGSGAIIFDGLTDTSLDDSATLKASTITLAANGINLGDAPTTASGLTLNNSLLATLQEDSDFTSLTLHSYGDINVYSGLNLNLNSSQSVTQITLNSQGIQGYGSDAKTISADNITLLGTGTGTSAGTSASGSLTLNASDTLTVGGSGSAAISGFDTVNFNAAGQIETTGSSQWQVYGNLNLTSQRVDGTAGSKVSLGSTGDLTVNNVTTTSTSPTLTSPELGATLTLSAGGNLTQSGTIATSGGILTLDAGDNLILSSTSSTSAAGVAQKFDDVTAYAPAGTINLTAQTGNITIAKGATVDVSGDSAGGAAGTLNIQATEGTLQALGTLTGSAISGQQQGQVSIDVNNLALNNSDSNNSNLDALLSTLQQGGFTDGQSLRVRTGNLDVSQNITAQNVSLSADQGSMTVSSIINSTGADGGSIALWAQGNIELDSGTQLLANATSSTELYAGKGGTVTLGSATGQVLATNSGSTAPVIDVRGLASDGSQDGQVNVRVLSTQSGSNAQLSAATIDSSNATIVEEVTVYSVAGGTVLDPSDTSELGQDSALTVSGGYSASSGTNVADDMSYIASNAPTTSGFSYRPGIEIDSTGSLTVGSSAGDGWDFASSSSPWAGIATNSSGTSVPINLTLRAAGNLTIAGSISDGFNGNTLLSGDSSSFRLVAGADITAANPMSTLAYSSTDTTGNFVLMPSQLVRTGDGNISVAAQGNINLGNVDPDTIYSGATLTAAQKSVIYTAGVPTSNDGTSYSLPSGATDAQLPADGGNISLSAGDDIIAAPSSQLVTNWEWRDSVTNATTKTVTNAQWIDFSQFQEGVATLGGGNISISAGNDIINLSAEIPATLYTSTTSAGVTTTDIVHGGGNLNVQAGNNIESGLYYVDHGTGTISADGSIDAGNTLVKDTNTAVLLNDLLPVYTILVQSNATINVTALQSIDIAGVFDPSLLPYSQSEASALNFKSTANEHTFYLSTATTDEGNFTSTSGDIDFMESAIMDAIPTSSISTNASLNSVPLATYPATLNATAFTGSINTSGAMAILPSATGNLSFLAADNISVGGNLDVSEADITDTALIPSATSAWSNQNNNNSNNAALLNEFYDLSSTPAPLATTPLHENDSTPITVIASQGSIIDVVGSNMSNGYTITFPKQAEFYAGTNIEDLDYYGTNLNNSVTTFSAGENIDLGTSRDSSGALTGNGNGINIAGNGWVELMAGDTINLGNSNGIVTTANSTDVRLPSSGATIIAMAGLGQSSDGGLRSPDYQDFINTYITGTGTTKVPEVYTSLLISFMEKLSGSSTLTAAQAATDFSALSRNQQLPLIAQVLYAELNATDIEHNTTGADYSRGRTAIATLFPSKDSSGNTLDYQGNLDMFASQMKTLQGGDIDLLLPGGSVIVGLADPPTGLTAGKTMLTEGDTQITVPAEANLGLLVFGEGGIYGYAADNFTVNQSRVLTLQGGNILLWADTGSIDAGHGANTVSAAPPPLVLTNADGTVFIDPLGAVSGSGIGQLLTVAGDTAGYVDLIAPDGIVNAGDAGIRVAGDLNIAALQVVGATNIHVGGTSSGVPVNDAGALAGSLSSASSLSDTAEQATDDVTRKIAENSAEQQTLQNNFQPSLISVEMVCLGGDCDSQ